MKRDELVFVVAEAEAPVRLGVFLRRRGVSMALLRSQKYRSSGILLNGKPAHTNAVLQAGDVAMLTLPPEPLSALPQPIPLKILYEDENAVVIDKPAGLVMHPTLSHHNGTLANGFSYWVQQQGLTIPFRPVGRLDADTSGLVLCAMNAYAAPLLARGMCKEYMALASGRMPLGKGEIEVSLGPRPDSAVIQQVSEQGKPALTQYEVLVAADAASLVRVWPRTGRTHQIRTHFAHIGHPLLGDSMYGGDKTLIGRHALHCARLRFSLQEGDAPVCLAAEMHPDMRAAQAAAGLVCECEN